MDRLYGEDKATSWDEFKLTDDYRDNFTRSIHTMEVTSVDRTDGLLLVMAGIPYHGGMSVPYQHKVSPEDNIDDFLDDMDVEEEKDLVGKRITAFHHKKGPSGHLIGPL